MNNNRMPLISVIVPVYNAEKYLHRCIESILAQSFADFELLLIDDGSKDNSGEICDGYAANDSRVRVFHKENGGVNAARKLGVETARSEWITFVDSDDYLLVNALQYLLEGSDCAEIVIGAYELNDNIISINGDECLDAIAYQHFVFSQSWHPWGKLYKRKLFAEDIFNIPPCIVHGEDAIMNIRVAFNVETRVRFISKPVYYYYQNDEGCCSTFKMSFIYFNKWYNYVYESIPVEHVKRFLNECIVLRLKHRNCILDYYIKNNVWHKHCFNKRLEQDIKQCNFKLKLTDRVFLICHNPISCFIFNAVINTFHRLMGLLHNYK